LNQYYQKHRRLIIDTIKKKRFGIFIWFGYRIPISERVQLIKECGFETVLHWWDDSFLDTEMYTKEEQVHIIRNQGLYIENAHLQFTDVNKLWFDTLDGQSVLDSYLSDIDGLAKYEIPVAVIHLTNGQTSPPVSDIGMFRIQKLVEKAEKCGTKIALENVRDTHILCRVLDIIESPMLGLCYDSGHDYIWSPTPYTLLEKFKDRLFAVHLHDNMGQNDDHLAPGTGQINWDIIRTGIENSIYTGSYTLEADSMIIPESRTPQEHLKLYYNSVVSVL